MKRGDEARSGRRIGVRELRASLADVIHWAASGERITVTVRGHPAAVIGPLASAEPVVSLELLVAGGHIAPPRRADRPTPPQPVAVPADVRVVDVIDRVRGRR